MEKREEIEAVYLDINKEEIEKELRAIGAEKTGDIFYRHSSYDYPDLRLDKDNSWIRLRDEGDKIILAFKKRLGVTSQDGSTNDDGMEEIETEVSSYEETAHFLKKIGMVEKHEAEKKRSRWQKREIIFDIDTWPSIPTLLEIEGPSWEEVDSAARLLNLDPENKKVCSVNQIYKIYGLDVDDYLKISFGGLIKKNSKKLNEQ